MKLSPTQIKEIAERALDAQCQALLKEWAKDGTLVKWMAERIAAQDGEIAKLEREEEEDIRARDEAQDALSAAHVALGGDGEWVFRIPAPEPPESGNLLRDVPALAAEVVRERDEARARIAQLESQIVVKDGALKQYEDSANWGVGYYTEAHWYGVNVTLDRYIKAPWLIAREALKGSAK